MTITTSGMDWLATYAGRNNCFADSGIAYTDADGVSHTGSTLEVATALVTANMVGKPDVSIVAGKSYNDWKDTNGGDISIDDLTKVRDNPTYCKETGTTPEPEPERAGMAGEFTVTTPGPVSGTMDISAAELRWNNARGKLDIDDIIVTNTSADRAYFGIFCKVWPAPQTTCPTSGTPAWKGPDLTSGGNIAVTGLDAGETGTINYDGYIGVGTLAPGTYVACVELYGNYSRTELIDELEAL